MLVLVDDYTKQIFVMSLTAKSQTHKVSDDKRLTTAVNLEFFSLLKELNLHGNRSKTSTIDGGLPMNCPFRTNRPGMEELSEQT